MSAGTYVPKSAESFQAPNDSDSAGSSGALHPAWRRFLCFCTELEHGEIERLKIQDGLPVLAEVTKKKVKFAL
jgi:hypothetical protein